MTFQNVELLSRTEVEALQNVRFQSVWPHIATTPLYKQKLAQEHVRVQTIQSLADLRRLPLLGKAEVRSSGVFDRTSLRSIDIYAIYSSGGSTGEQTLYAWSKKDVAVQTEVAQRMMSSLGIEGSDLGLVLAPLSLPVMGHCMIRQFTAINAGFVPVGQTCPGEVISLLADLPITVVSTLPVVASRLHDYMKFAVNLDVEEKIQIRMFLFGGDYLSSIRRRRLEQAWGASCYDFYGISEIFGPLAGECSYCDGLHFAADYVFVELLHPHTKEPVPEGEAGVAVYTTLWEKAFPLLRYWSDDYVTWTWDPCACGRKTPRLRFLGRPADSAVFGNKRIFARDVEEVILNFPVSHEYYCEYIIRKDKAIVQANIESVVDLSLPTKELREALENLFGITVQINILEPGTIPRDQVKPKRLMGFPKGKS